MTQFQNKIFDVIIAGAGLAGLTAAINLRKRGWEVLCIEKNELPRHKVCGEFLSNEIRPYLISLGFNPKDYGSKDIDQFAIYGQNGSSITQKLEMAGFGLSRYAMDKELYNLAQKEGVYFLKGELIEIEDVAVGKKVICKNGMSFESRAFISALGKRSKFDITFDRDFIKKRTNWMGVKAHYKGDWQENKVALFQFNGGYCGISKVEGDAINVCYLVDTEVFKKTGDLDKFEKEVMCLNPSFKSVYDKIERKMERKVISQIYFGNKEKSKNNVAFLGDSAGMIFPLAGNGMAMAIHSSKIYCDLLDSFLNGKNSLDRIQALYKSQWETYFNNRIQNSRKIQKLMTNNLLSSMAINILPLFPFIFRKIIKSTHGKEVDVFTNFRIYERTT